MKKTYLLIGAIPVIAIITIFCLTGCGKLDEKEIRNNFIKEVEGLKSYYLEGQLNLTNNDDTYEYDVEVSYQKDDKYKVSLTNKANDYEQIILKNSDELYVITPSLNKSFKFQSDWPNNNSQSYLLNSVAKDLKDDSAYTFTQKDNNYIFTTKTNYPNNPKYVKQNIILDKDYNLKKVEVQDEEGITYIEFTVKNLDKKAKFNESEFSLDEITKEFDTKEDVTEEQNQGQTEENQQEEQVAPNQTEESNTNENNQTNTNNNQEIQDQNEAEQETNNESNETEETSKIDENIFPLYLPTNTSLSDREVISTEAGERVIMTFSGDNPFILVQETVKASEELEIIPTYGEPFMLIDTVGSLTDTSYTWTSNGVEYYIVSDQMDQGELLEVAKSINMVSAISEK